MGQATNQGLPLPRLRKNHEGLMILQASVSNPKVKNHMGDYISNLPAQ